MSTTFFTRSMIHMLLAAMLPLIVHDAIRPSH